MTDAAPTITPVEWDLADRLRKALRVSGISVSEMADYLDVGRNTVSTWINGHITPSTQSVRLFALRTGVPYEWLVTGELPTLSPDGTPTLGSSPGAWNADGAAQVIPFRHAA